MTMANKVMGRYVDFKSDVEAYNDAIKGADESKTFTGLRHRMQASKQFLADERAKVKAAPVPKLLDPKQYKQMLWNKYKEKESQVQIGTLREIDSLLDEKRKAISEMINTPPTSEQTQLLQTLSMRKNISPEEIREIARQMYTNYQALATLSDISTEHGYNLFLPLNTDVPAMKQALERADEYLHAAARDINKVGKAEGASPRFWVFYTICPPDITEGADPEFQTILDALDSTPQLNSFEISDTLSPTEETRVAAYFSNVDARRPDSTAQIAAVIEAHADELGLMERSKDWGKIVHTTKQIMDIAGGYTPKEVAEMPYYERPL